MKIKKIISVLAAAVFAVSLSGACARKEAPKEETSIRVLAQKEYIPDDTVIRFQEETGCKLKFNSYVSDDDMLSQLERYGDYDLVIGEGYTVPKAVQGGLLRELDKSKIPNFKNISEAYLGAYFDSESKYMAPYTLETSVIVYDKSKAGMEIKSCGDLWDPSLAGKVMLYDDAESMSVLALKAIGRSANETDDAALEEAKAKLLELKDNIAGISSDTELLVNGGAAAAYMPASLAAEALEANPELTAVYPEEGLVLKTEGWLVPEKAQNPDGAYEFINYVLDAKNAASVSGELMRITANSAAKKYLPKEYKENAAVNIPDESLSNAEPARMNVSDEALAKYDEIAAALKQLQNE